MAQQDFREAESTYGGFITLFKWGSVAVALVVAFIIVLIS
jgi:hypothetical protein